MINILKIRNSSLSRYLGMPTTVTLLCCLAAIPTFSQPVTSDQLPGLKYIPSKTFTGLSYTGADTAGTVKARTVSVQGFYIKISEVTNKEYREFTNYVRDSIAHGFLQHFKRGGKHLDWNAKINWSDPRLTAMMVALEESLTGKRQIDPQQLKFRLEWSGNEELISIYPDTLVWMSDFAYSYNEPLAKNYFSNPKYDNYPVVGVNLKQAMAFCHWKTAQLNQEKSGKKQLVRLPTNHEWEAAAMEHQDAAKPVSGHDYKCNFGLITDKGFTVKDYADDGYYYTSPVKKFNPGDYGLYDMKGNVAEWTVTPVEEIGIANGSRAEYVVKGGGWNSSPFYLQPGVCQFFGDAESHCYLGFRYVVQISDKK